MATSNLWVIEIKWYGKWKFFTTDEDWIKKDALYNLKCLRCPRIKYRVVEYIRKEK